MVEFRVGLRVVLDYLFYNVKVFLGIYDYFWYYLWYVLYYCNFMKIICFVILWIMVLEIIIEVVFLYLLRINSLVSVFFVIEMLGLGCVLMLLWWVV